jgi:hypothetical protein
MTDNRFDLSDTGLAFLIGALTGVGVVLLLRSGVDDTEHVIRRLRESGVPAHRATPRRERELGRLVELTRSIRELNGS